MKKIVLSLLFALAAVAVPFKSSAAGFGEVNISYGGYTAMDAIDGYGSAGYNTAWGALNAGVYFNLMPKIQLGASYSFSSASGKHDWSGNAYYHVILANVKYQYYRNSMVKLYAHVGLGPEFTHWSDTDDTKAHFGFQVSPIGATVDLTPNFGLFGEAGFGCQGIVQLGVKIGF